MISRTTIGRSFGGVVRYQFEGRKEQPSDKQAEVLAAVGVRTDSAAHMSADFNRGRQLNPNLGQAVWHTSLSFNPDDAAKLDSAKMLAIAEGYVQKMGLDKTQYAIIRHHDQPDNQHLHIIANRVGDDGQTIKDGQNFFRSKLALKELIQEHSLTPPQGLRVEQQHAPSDKAELAKYEIKQVLHQALATATDRPALLATLRAEKISAQEFTNKAGTVTGISFEKDGHVFKGSAVAREYSLAGLDKQLAANQVRQQAEQARQVAAQEAAVQRQMARAQEREQLRQALAVVLATATDSETLSAGLRAHGMGYRIAKNEAGQRVSISFSSIQSQSAHVFEGTELNPAYSIAGMEALVKANRLAANLVRQQARQVVAQEAAAQAQRQVAQRQAAERQEAERWAAQATKVPELPAVERKWQAAYPQYLAEIAQQNAPIQAFNKLVNSASEHLELYPNEEGLSVVLRKLAGDPQTAQLRADLAQQEEARAYYQKNWDITYGQRDALEKKAKGGFFISWAAQQAAKEKVAYLNDPTLPEPDVLQGDLLAFSRAVRAATQPARTVSIEARAYQQPEVVPLSLTAYAAQREAEYQAVAQAQRQAPGQREAQQPPAPKLKPEPPQEEAPTRQVKGPKR
jgi:hypothetical protein